MIRCNQPSPPPAPSTRSTLPTTADRHGSNGYGWPFVLAYVANMLTMIGVALLFRYADLVTVLGGTEWHLGWIVGVGMVGSLAMRFALGVSIDHYGTRLVWLLSLVLFAATNLSHLWITAPTGPTIYLLRIAYCSSLAGIFGASLTFVSGRVPPQRMAELIGMLGSAGFVGMVVGTQLGDLLVDSASATRLQVDRMFLVAGLLGCAATVFAFLATWRQPRPKRRPHTPLLRVLREYNPGPVALMGVVMGIGIGLPGVFLCSYAATIDLGRIGLFFGVYSPTALLTRIVTRHWPERYGTTAIILSGTASLVIGQLLFLAVSQQWQLALPAVFYGFAHAVMFPSIVSAGSQRFPEVHRGLAMIVMLATYDIGQLIGAPLAGVILQFGRQAGFPPYPTMFISMAVLLSVCTAGFIVAQRLAMVRRPTSAIPCPHKAEPIAPAIEAVSVCENDG